MRPSSLLRGAHAYLTPTAALAGLTAAHANRKAGPGAHSIAEIVAHMAFWQDWFLDRCDGVSSPMPAPAARGWPPVREGDWETVLGRFERGFDRALALAEGDARSTQSVTPAIEFEPLARYTVGDVLTHLALHNAHHVGQVITLRQLQGTWPPPAGSWTW
jgi:uncharacterized damage-inducible protein DinB